MSSSYYHQKVDIDEEESVYNLIEKPVEVREKKEMYRSAYPGTTPPSYSTFALKNTSKPGVANAGGSYFDLDVLGGHHTMKKSFATMGRPVKHDVKPDSFTKKNQGHYSDVIKTMETQKTKKFERTLPEGVSKRPPIPKKDEKPIMGLITKKNYVVSNAVDNILSAPRKVKQPEPLWTQKAEYGKVPDYLAKIKQEMQDEYEYIQSLQQQNDTTGKSMRKLSEDEKESLIDGLRKKWNELHERYQSFSFAMPNDKVHIQRKEAVEQQMDEIEKSIIKLSKQNIFVYDEEDIGY
ncbi:hypothetical protein FDP41_005209 [Naegleria fowleri]|uniref:Enkurin domain-containing protein n=1 Tax=Naegleria fowleri TaxID=5763 RepID=A0A6A5BLZ1_NAEFO|nr:uncharacterized protein FDP41_005209 [Naegleria fowleri]KAF0975882.1 hypothetical protein FDP41_005209 [Naegleria fowleri]